MSASACRSRPSCCRRHVVTTLTIDLGPSAPRTGREPGLALHEAHASHRRAASSASFMAASRSSDLMIEGLAADRSALLHRQASVAFDRLVAHHLAATRADHHVGRDDRLADAGRTSSRTATTSRSSRYRTPSGVRAVSHPPRVICGRRAASSPTKTTRCRGAILAPEPRSDDHQFPRLSRRGHVPRRPDHDPELRADVDRTSRRASPSTAPKVRLDQRADRHRRRADGRGRAPSTSTTGPSRPIRSDRACSFRGCARYSSPRNTWNLDGDGDFNGVFHLFKGGHDLSGNFTSPLAGVNEYRFPVALRIAALDAQISSRSTNAGSQLYGGNARFTFGIAARFTGPSDGAIRRVLHRTSIWRSCRISTSWPASGLPAVRRAGTCSNGRSADSASIAAKVRSSPQRRRVR